MPLRSRHASTPDPAERLAALARTSRAAGSAIARCDPFVYRGRVAEANATLIKATGIKASVGELCLLRDPQTGWQLEAEVVGLLGTCTLLTPLGSIAGINAGTEVLARGARQEVAVGDGVLGRVLDAHGQPLDGRGPLIDACRAPVQADPPNPLQRPPVHKVFATGVRAIDTVLTCGEGQRMGVFAPAGAGKSTLVGMLARGSCADVNVIALVGERGREVNEFIEDHLGAAGMAKSVVVAATSDRPAMERAKAAYVATAVAEHFRDRGKRVLLLVDSVTRFARALRDIGLAAGEPPARRGFPPSVFSALPGLFERAGNNPHGSITAFYTVLFEDEELGDPVAEEVLSILDGHIILTRKLASAYHYPAIDVLASASRVMSRVAEPAHLREAGRLRTLLAKHRDIELLLQLGEYKPGGDADADEAIRRLPALLAVLQQPTDQFVDYAAALASLSQALQ